MSTPIEFESAARQDFGPTASTSDFEPLLVHKLADTMSIPSVDVPPHQAMSSDGHSEPDSTEPAALHDLRTKLDKLHDYCDPEPAADRDLTPVATSALVQNYTKLPHSYTLNVDATVSSIAAIQSTPCVTSSNQMLLLPTILATGGPVLDGKPLDGAGSPTALSQIIITSESYPVNNFNQPGARRANIIPEANFITRPKAAKVQILSNISIPKTTSVATYSQQYVSGDASLYSSSDHVYKLSASVASIHMKQLNHSVISKPKNPTSVNYPNMSSTVISQAHIKSVAYTHTFSKGTNPNKSLNKVNNGANPNAGPVGPTGNNQCHILSRVVSGPKLAVQPGRKPLNTFGSKTVKNASQNTTPGGPKNQSRSIKIIQQTGASKPEMKSWAVANVNSKMGASYGAEASVKNTPQKTSPTHKSSHPLLSQKPGKNEQRVVLQSPCGPVLISTAPISVSHHRPPHYVQSGAPSLRYVHNYVHQPSEAILPGLPSSNLNQMSANQHLTAQILQSLSQPKLMLQSSAPLQSLPSAPLHSLPLQEPYVPLPPKPVQHRRHISGDPSTRLTADDIIGMEERPNLTEEIIRYSHDSLAFVMLDHTYALCAQKLSPVATCSPSVIASAPPLGSPAPAPAAATPPSPVECIAPAVTSTVQLAELQTVPALIVPPVPSSPISTVPPLSSFSYKPAPLPPRPEEDDAASAISSLDGRGPDRAGSDTETAPEGEEEGKTRCICDFTHDDGYMICCDRCGEWQHVDCMGIDRQNIPDAYQCDLCQPRHVDRRRARAIQMRKREELSALVASDSDSSDLGMLSPGTRRKRLLTVTTYSDTSGACVTTYNNVPPVPPPQPPPPPPQPKRIPVKRPKKTEMIRKGTKRKLTEKRVKRKKEMMMNRSKYTGVSSAPGGWHEAYEQAVTNHYSPELRAKVIRYGSKPGNTLNTAQAVAAHYCSTVPHAGGKILIATRNLKESTPIVELRGKYMLSTQHRPQIQVSGRTGGQKPGPFVFFYRLPRDNTQVCIDTRTYGNEARFVRRSCKYNAELQHCIVKGTLHVYIVSMGAILDGTEITIPHDLSGGKQPCACGNPKHCKLNGLHTVAARKAPAEYTQREKRTRHRRSSSSSAGSPLESPREVPERRISVINTDIKPPMKLELGSPVKSWGTAFTDAPASDSIFKEEKPEAELIFPKIEPIKSEDAVNVPAEVPKLEPKEELPEIKEPEAVEVKMEIEPEVIAKVLYPPPLKELKEEVMKEEPPMMIIEPEMIPMPDDPPPKPKEDEKVTRSVTARSACHERSTRSSRASTAASVNQDSMDEKTDDSQDKPQPAAAAKEKRKMTREERKMEAIMRAFERMEKAEQRKQEVRERQSRRRESDPAPPTAADKEADDDDSAAPAKKRRQRKGRARTTSQNTSRHRLNSADSDLVTSGDEAAPTSPPQDDPPEPTPVPLQSPVTPDVGLSSACLLVEAAVGPLESAFKLPKTKKTMANEWVGRSPEHTPYASSYRPALLSARSLESLVRVASTMIGDLGGNTSEPEDGSPPRTPTRDKNRPPKKIKRGANKTVVPEQPVVPLPQHSAKKRWLRQAISEESDSPTAESPPNEMVTPLKKRRLARESLSLDQPAVLPSKPEEVMSPIITCEDSPTKEDCRDSITRHCKMKSRYIDSMYGSEYSSTDHSMDAQNVFLNMNLKDPRDEKFNLDIRRIIGVPGTEDSCDDIPMPKEPEERPKPMDVNDNEFHISLPDEDKAPKPMEIDTEISPHRMSDVADEPIAGTKPLDNQTESKTSIHSNDTSGNSSPQRDEMDDIQKKIHSFHTENIQILKIRNKKPPKEKRKKVNLNFDLNMVDDQISIQLRTDGSPRPDEINGDVHGKVSAYDDPIMYPAPDTIPLPPVESIPLPDTEFPMPDPRFIPLPEFIPLPSEPMMRLSTPEPVRQLPTPEPVKWSSTPEPVKRSPTPEPVKRSPTPEPVTRSPTPEPVKRSPTPEPVKRSPTPEPVKRSPSPEPVKRSPTPEPVRLSPTPEPVRSPIVPPEPVLPTVVLAPIALDTPIVTTSAMVSQIELKDDTPPVSPKIQVEKPEESLPFSTRFTSTGLFSGIFNNMNTTTSDAAINENVPHLNIIGTINKNMMEGGTFSDKAPATPVDELRNVQEILNRVNSMDSNTSVILSGVLKNSDHGNKPEPLTPAKTYCPRSNDPRLNPPPADKPKPVRRKLSITEYLKRHKTSSGTCGGEGGDTPVGGMGCGSADAEGGRMSEWSSDSSAAASRSPLRLDAGASNTNEDLEMRLNQALRVPPTGSLNARGVSVGGGVTGEFDAQPTQLERQRENLSQRLRREFGLSLPEDEEARSATALQEIVMLSAGGGAGSAEAAGPGAGAAEAVTDTFPRPSAPHKPSRFDR